MHTQVITKPANHFNPVNKVKITPAKERNVWAEIDINKFRKNVTDIKAFLMPQVQVMGILKANAYGHGIVQMARELEKLGVNYLAVACIHEGKQLREAGITLPILLLGYTDKTSVYLALRNNLTITVTDELVLEEVAKVAELIGITAKVHINIDTGIHFYGVTPDNAIALITKTQQYTSLFLEGIFSHFADAESDDLTYSYQQLETFNHILTKVKKKGINPPHIHMANGAAIARMPEAHFTMVRPGTFLFGPQTGTQIKEFVPEQILSLKTEITSIRELLPGESVGYGQSFRAGDKSIVASIPVGYGDGLHRSKDYLGYVLVRGQRAPIIIKPAMDQTAIDISHIRGVEVGDEVVIVGEQGKEKITLNEIAEKTNRANYEILTGITERVVKIYKD